MPLVSSTRRAWGKCGRIKDLIAVVTIQSEWEAAITFTIGTENKAKGHDKMTKDLKKRRTETKLNYRLQTNEKTFCNAIVSWRNMMFFPLLLVINLNWPNYSPSFLHLYIMHLLFSFFFLGRHLAKWLVFRSWGICVWPESSYTSVFPVMIYFSASFIIWTPLACKISWTRVYLPNSLHSFYGFSWPFFMLSSGYRRSFIIFWLPSRSSLVSCYLVGDFVFFSLLLSYPPFVYVCLQGPNQPCTVPFSPFHIPNRLWLQSFAKALITLHQLQRSWRNLKSKIMEKFYDFHVLKIHSQFDLSKRWRKFL